MADDYVPTYTFLNDLIGRADDDPQTLLKHNYLCREGVLLIVGQTGIGKSSFSMQCMISWAIGQAAFGIEPARPLKSLLIQAENDDGDLAEMRDGIYKGMNLPTEKMEKAGEMIICVHEDSHSGEDFVAKVVIPALESRKPDLLWIDPALAYLGGDTSSQKDVGSFLRNMLKPLLTKQNCGCVIIHHTNKTGSGDSVYAGSGSAEWANMSRAILVIERKGQGFELKAVKRGIRLKWKDRNGNLTTTKYLQHSEQEEEIFWNEIEGENEGMNTKNDVTILDHECLKRIPDGGIEKNKLEELVNKETGFGKNKVWKHIKQMIEEHKLRTREQPRTNARPEILIERPDCSEPPKSVLPG